jgi:hypothetical protein
MKRFEFAHVAEGIARQAGALLRGGRRLRGNVFPVTGIVYSRSQGVSGNRWYLNHAS